MVVIIVVVRCGCPYSIDPPPAPLHCPCTLPIPPASKPHRPGWPVFLAHTVNKLPTGLPPSDDLVAWTLISALVIFTLAYTHQSCKPVTLYERKESRIFIRIRPMLFTFASDRRNGHNDKRAKVVDPSSAMRTLKPVLTPSTHMLLSLEDHEN